MIRTFIACKIAATPALRALHADLQELGRTVRPVSLENLHITLQFLGDTEPELIPQVAQAVTDAVAGHDEFLIEIAGLGVFPHLRRPTVVWAGLQETEPLREIATALTKPLGKLGFQAEKRQYKPHLTLARVRGTAPRELATYMEQHPETDFGSEIIESVELYESELTPSGAQYRVLARFDLGG